MLAPLLPVFTTRFTLVHNLINPSTDACNAFLESLDLVLPTKVVRPRLQLLLHDRQTLDAQVIFDAPNASWPVEAPPSTRLHPLRNYEYQR